MLRYNRILIAIISKRLMKKPIVPRPVEPDI
jgi:hypothetical protein